MKTSTLPTFCAFLTESQVDDIRGQFRSHHSAILVNGKMVSSKFDIGEDVVVWLFGQNYLNGIDATVIDTYVLSVEEDMKDIIGYTLAVPAQENGVYMALQNVTKFISKASALEPEYFQDEWPAEVIQDRTPITRKTHLMRVK